jgi:hypothetical protein
MDDYVGTGTQSQDYDAMSVGGEDDSVDSVPSTPGSKLRDESPSLAIAASGAPPSPPSAQKSQRKSYTVAPFWS